MTARILLSGLIPRPIRPAPCSGTLIRYPDQVWRGQIIGACGCVTRFEAVEQDSEFGVFYRLFELSETERLAQRLDLTRDREIHSRDTRRGGACGNANATVTKRNAAPGKEAAHAIGFWLCDKIQNPTIRSVLQALSRATRTAVVRFFRGGFLKGES